MNIYVWKGRDAWELALGNTPAEAAETMDLYFEGSQSNPEMMELYGQLQGEDRSYYYGYIDPRNTDDYTAPTPDLFMAVYGFQHPLFHFKLIEDLQRVSNELNELKVNYALLVQKVDDFQKAVDKAEIDMHISDRDLKRDIMQGIWRETSFEVVVDFSELVDENIYCQLNREFIDMAEAENCINEAIKQLQSQLPDLREEVYNIS